MLRYDRQTKPGLVALYNIRPGNGAGPFLQPRSPQGASQLYVLLQTWWLNTEYSTYHVEICSGQILILK